MSSKANSKRAPLAQTHPMYGIYRKEANIYGLCGCWQVFIRREPAPYAASFSDGVFQSKENALRAAQTFRDALLARLPDTSLMKYGREHKTYTNLKGVRRCKHGEHDYWLARLKKDEKTFVRYFQIKKYGEEGAKQRAIETRATWVKMLCGDTMLPLPSQEEIRQLAKTVGAQFGKKIARKKSVKPLDPNISEMDRYGIYRNEPDITGKGGGWKVSIGRYSKAYEKQFSDSTAGGKEASLSEAINYRNELLVNIQPMSMRERHEWRRSDNTSGFAGVRLRKKNGAAVSWVARITVEGKQRSTSFSIEKYGDQQAFELAVAARQVLLNEKLSTLDNPYFVQSAAAKKWYSKKNKA
ncbi:MAG: AP2/ERF family transcription factor [Pseudomonadota bacterium]